MLLTLILASAALLLLMPVWKLFKWYKHLQRLRLVVPESSNSHWLRGHMSADGREDKPAYLEMARKMPRMFLRWVGPIPLVNLLHPETVADYMRLGPGKFQFLYDFYKPWLGNGLVLSAGPRWYRDRRLLSHAFTPDMLRSYVPVYKDACSVMLDLWSSCLGKRLEVGPYVKLLTFDVIMRCAMGVHSNCQMETDENDPTLRYHSSMETLMTLLFERYTQPWYYNDWIFLMSPSGRLLQRSLDFMRGYGRSLIHNRREELKNSDSNETMDPESHGRDMLDILVTVKDEDGMGLSDDEICAHVDTFLFAGRDTSARTMEWVILHMTDYPSLQEKCRSEVQHVVENCGGLEQFGREQLDHLTYLTCFIQETLRYTPTLPFIGKCSSKNVLVDGVVLPAGTSVHISMLGLHHNAEVWESPEKFNPDRFLPGGKRRHPYAFIPFSAGARSCIGKHFAMDEMKVVLSMILLKYRLLKDPDSPATYWKDDGISKAAPAVNVRLELI